MNGQSRGINWWMVAVILSLIFAPDVAFRLSNHLSKGTISFGFSVINLIGEERTKSIKETEGWLK